MTKIESMVTTMTTIPSIAVLPACPSLSGATATFASAALPLPVPAAAPLWAGVLARPQGRVVATGVGYAAMVAAAGAKRREVDPDVIGSSADGKRTNGATSSTTQQQGQLHLMSRRDPRTWRPPV